MSFLNVSVPKIASVKLPLHEVTKFLKRLGSMEPNLAPEFTLRIEGYTHANTTEANVTQHAPWTSYMLNTIDESREEGLVTLSMYWMGDSSPDDPVGMQFIKNEIVPLFPSNLTADKILYYYFSWTGLSREREQNPMLNPSLNAGI